MRRNKRKYFGIGIIRRQELAAVVTRACANCGAPGFWHDVPNVNVGCYDPTRKNQPITESNCPNCGAVRPAPEDRGVIWVREWTVWELLGDQIRGLIRSLKWKFNTRFTR